MQYSTSVLRSLTVVAVLVAFTTAPFAQQAVPETWDLSLDEAFRTALANNLSLVSARQDPAMAEQDVIVQDAAYDVGLEAKVSRFESQRAITTDLSTTSSSSTDQYSVGASQALKFGANYTAALFSSHDVLAGGFTTEPDSWTSGVNLNFNMPLLKGFGTESTTEQLVLARSAVEISWDDLEVSAHRLVEQVEGAYWDVLAARAALRIARLSLQRAEDLLGLNRKKVEVGTLAPIEITQAEAGVASQEEGVIVAETTLVDAEDELRRLLAIPESDPRWAASIECTDRPDFEPRDTDLDAAIETALVERPELSTARRTVRDRELSERVAKRRVRHQLDFDSNFRPLGIDTGSTDSVSKVADLNDYSWNAGLTYRIPIGNHADKARFARASISREKSQIALDDQEQTIRVEVRRAVRAVESGLKRVDAATVNVGLQQKKLEAEQKKFENGMSTSFEVLTFQNDLADAELAAVRAQLDYVRSVAALERSKGTLLEARGLSLD